LLNRKVVLKLHEHDISSWIPMSITMLLGMASILDIPEIIKVLVGAIYVMTLLYLPPDESIKYLMFNLCANELLDIGSTSLMMIFVCLYSVMQCIQQSKSLKITTSVFLSVGLLLAMGIMVYVSFGTIQALLDTIKHVFFLCYTAFVLKESNGEWRKLYVSVFRYIALGVMYFTALAIVKNGAASISDRFTPSEEITINFFGITCGFSIVNMIYSAMVLREKTCTNFYLIGGCCICGLLTQSRTFILAVAIGVVLILAFIPSMHLKFCFIMVGVLCGIVCVLAYTNIPAFESVVNAVLGRILKPSNGDISNGRYDLWATTISAMMENSTYFWFGAGDYETIGAIEEGKVRVAHNLFLETWVVFGIIGCAILVLIYILYLKQYLLSARRNGFRMVTIAPLSVMLCCLFYSHHFIGRSMSIVFVLSFLPIAIGISKESWEIK